jgi:tetratricopeptide (TPR) repeat protein
MELTTRPKTSGRLVWFIVAGLAASVVVPVAVAIWPIEKAKWLLAAAENTVELAERDDLESQTRAKELLHRAEELDPGIAERFEFHKVKFLLDPGESSGIFESLKKLDPNIQILAADYLAQRLAARGEFAQAFTVLKAGLSSLKSLEPEQKNELAYYAALANLDIDQALKWIEEAIEEDRNSGYLDTKAWVLYRAGSFAEALTNIDEAEALLEKEAVKWSPFSTESKLLEALMEGKPPFTPRKANEETAPATLGQNARDLVRRIHGTIIYRYHQAEILKALGRNKEAEDAFEWLRQRGFDDFTKLF